MGRTTSILYTYEINPFSYDSVRDQKDCRKPFISAEKLRFG